MLQTLKRIISTANTIHDRPYTYKNNQKRSQKMSIFIFCWLISVGTQIGIHKACNSRILYQSIPTSKNGKENYLIQENDTQR